MLKNGIGLRKRAKAKYESAWPFLFIKIINMSVEKIYMNEVEASHRYGYSRQWFQRERWKGTGPKFVKINNGRVLYPILETDEWFASFGLKQSTSV